MSSIHDPRYKKAVQKLINMREYKQITQVQLALSLKKPQSYIAKVENCERRLDFAELYDWVKALDSEVSFVFTDFDT